MQSVAQLTQIEAEGSKMAPDRCRTQQNDPRSRQSVHSLDIELPLRTRRPRSVQRAAKRPHVKAERSKTTPNQCRMQQNDPHRSECSKITQIGAECSKTSQICAECSKTTPKPLQNAAKRPKSVQNAAKRFKSVQNAAKTTPKP